MDWRDDVLPPVLKHHRVFQDPARAGRKQAYLVEIQLAAYLKVVGFYGNAASPQAIAIFLGCAEGSVFTFFLRSLTEIFSNPKDLICRMITSQPGLRLEFSRDFGCPDLLLLWMERLFPWRGSQNSNMLRISSIESVITHSIVSSSMMIDRRSMTTAQ